MADRYWVNRSGGTGSMGSGSGNWNDTNNWSATSGGNGGAGVPTSSDSVFFDDSTAANCTLDTTPTIIDWTISSGYSGSTLSLGIYTVTCTGDVSIASDASMLDAGTSTVVMGGASAQTIGNPTLSNAFYRLTVSQNVGLTDDIYVNDGYLTISTDYYINTQLVAGTGYNIHLRGSGTVLYLNGWIRSYGTGNIGVIYFELDQDSTVMNIPGGTGYDVNGTYTAVALRCRLIGNISGTFSLQGAIANVDNFIVWADTSTASCTFNTNDYDMTLYSFSLWGSSDTSTDGPLTCNFGSSAITHAQLARFVSNNGATYNLQTSQWTVGQWSPYPDDTGAVTVAPTFNVGTSKVTVNSSSGMGESWQSDCEFVHLYDLTLSPTGATSTCWVKFTAYGTMTLTADKSYVMDSSVTANNLSASATTGNILVTFDTASKSSFGSLDLSGTGSNLVTLQSETAGTPWAAEMTGYSIVDHVSVSDSEMVGQEIDALDPTNTDGGNNGPSWVFDDNQQAVSIA